MDIDLASHPDGDDAQHGFGTRPKGLFRPV